MKEQRCMQIVVGEKEVVFTAMPRRCFSISREDFDRAMAGNESTCEKLVAGLRHMIIRTSPSIVADILNNGMSINVAQPQLEKMFEVELGLFGPWRISNDVDHDDSGEKHE